MILDRIFRRPVTLIVASLVAAAPLLPLRPARAQSGPRDAADVTAMQRDVVARLTGYAPAGPDGAGGARSTPAERARAATYLLGALEELGLPALRHDYRWRNVNAIVDLLLPPFKGTNVYTLLEATVPSTEYVVVGAHYDREPGSPGAVDNAAGVALVHALAYRLSRLDERRLSFLLVFFDQEEDDEVGSKAFARFLAKQPYGVHSVHVTDVIAWDENGDRAVEVESPGPYLERHYERAAARLGISMTVTPGASSDNKSFLEAGYRTAGIWSEELTPHLHKSSDTYTTVSFEMLASATELLFEVLTNLTPEGPSDER